MPGCAGQLKMLLHVVSDSLERSLLQREQQSLLKVRSPAVCVAAHCCAWHVARTPCYSLLLIPPLLEAGKGLRFAPSQSEGFPGGESGLQPLSSVDSGSASVTQLAQVQSSGLLSACMCWVSCSVDPCVESSINTHVDGETEDEKWSWSQDQHIAESRFNQSQVCLMPKPTWLSTALYCGQISSPLGTSVASSIKWGEALVTGRYPGQGLA